MTTSPLTTAWDTASKHCWSTIETATAIAKIIDVLKDLPVEAVIPVVSTIQPTLNLVPPYADDRREVVLFAERVKTAVQTDIHWEHVPSGDNWTLRLKLPALTVVILTSIPAQQPTEFKVTA